MTRTRWAFVALAVLLLVLTMAWASRSRVSYSDALDPLNPRPSGAQAAAKVLQRQGVPVSIARSQTQLLRQRIDADTVVVVTSLHALGPSTFEPLRRHSSNAKAQIYIGDGFLLTELFELGSPRGGADGKVAARCATDLVTDLTLRARAAISIHDRGCFRVGGDSLLVESEPRTWLLAAANVASNRDITKADNAALTLRLLGQGTRVVWYVPDVRDTDPSDGRSLLALLPRAVVPLVFLAGFVLVAFVLWRGRRFGPLVTEPIPVVVQASETTLARGRLYEKSRDREHAAGVLANATRERLRVVLRVPGMPTADLVTLVAGRTGRHESDVRRLLDPPTPADDAALAELARALLTLEDEVPR